MSVDTATPYELLCDLAGRRGWRVRLFSTGTKRIHPTRPSEIDRLIVVAESKLVRIFLGASACRTLDEAAELALAGLATHGLLRR